MQRTLLLLIAGGVLSSALSAAVPLAGCRAAPPAPAPQSHSIADALPGMAEMSDKERAEVFERGFRRQLGPGARVGVVSSVEGETARIAELDTAGLRAGDGLMFFDAAGRAVALGRVGGVDAESAFATFDATLVQDGRDPRSGDFAVFNLQAAAP